MQTKINSFFKPQCRNPSLKTLKSHIISAQENGENQRESTTEILNNGINNLVVGSTQEEDSSNGDALEDTHRADEKVHKELHKEYTQGIQFKGWQNERVVSKSSKEAGRIILILDEDPPAHKKKVEKVLQMMEVELGSGNLIHKLCKVYLFLFQRRTVGCLIVEPISEAYRVLSKSEPPKSLDNPITKKNRPESSVLQFGDITLQREASEKKASRDKHKALTEDFMGALLLDEEAVHATCGIRAIWVVPAMRRQHIATELLDAVRQTFSEGIVLDPSQMAFSDPTSTGRALAFRYCGNPLLAYRAF